MSMGPLHGSASIHDKVASIRRALRDGHDHAADGLQVIMDFDLTMTAPGSEQCHHMFETSSALPAELRNKLSPFFTGQIEVSSREEWWDGFHAVLIDARLTKTQVADVAKGADVTLRHGTAELMRLLQEQGVPLLVLSAGIGNIVEETLREHGLLLDNVTVRANTMLFGDDGRLNRFRESPPVHSRNKQQTAERERAYFDAHPDRRCVIVVGDKPGDADVNHGIAPDDRCLKIGFFDHSHEHPHPDLPPLPPPPSATLEASGSCNTTTTADIHSSSRSSSSSSCSDSDAPGSDPERSSRVSTQQSGVTTVTTVIVSQESISLSSSSPLPAVVDPRTAAGSFLQHESDGSESPGNGGRQYAVVEAVVEAAAQEEEAEEEEKEEEIEETRQLDFLRENRRILGFFAGRQAPTKATIATATATTTAVGSFLSSAPKNSITGRPGSQGGGEIYMSGGGVSLDVGGSGNGGGITGVASFMQEAQRANPPRGVVAGQPGATAVSNPSRTTSIPSEAVRAGAAAEANAAAITRGGDEGRPAETVAVEEMLRAYGDSFDIVACGGHSMDLVTDFVRHFIRSLEEEEEEDEEKTAATRRQF